MLFGSTSSVLVAALAAHAYGATLGDNCVRKPLRDCSIVFGFLVRSKEAVSSQPVTVQSAVKAGHPFAVSRHDQLRYAAEDVLRHQAAVTHAKLHRPTSQHPTGVSGCEDTC